MSVPRLNFLYPHLFHSIKTSEPIVSRRSLRVHPKQGCSAGFSSTTRSKQETFAQRYGPANEPIPPSQLPTSPPESSIDKKGTDSLSTAIEKEVNAAPTQKQDAKQNPPASKESEKVVKEASSEVSAINIGVVAPKSQERPTELDAAESHPKEQHALPKKEVAEAKPLERVLQMASPDEEHKPPHLHAPPYVHHFDTFTLVRNLEKEGFTQAQSVTLMKAVRSLLALNLDVAREGLVSKSDVENVGPSVLYSSHFGPLPLQVRLTEVPRIDNESGNLPLPCCLLGTPHRNPRPPPQLRRHKNYPTFAPPARSGHSLPACFARLYRPERRSPWPAQ